MEGWGGGGGGGCIFSNLPTPTQLLFISFPTYQCNTQQVVVKMVISAGDFHVSGKKFHLTKTEMESEVQGTLKREMVYTNHELPTKSLSETMFLDANNILFVPKKLYKLHCSSPNNSNCQRAQLTILYSVDTTNRE